MHFYAFSRRSHEKRNIAEFAPNVENHRGCCQSISFSSNRYFCNHARLYAISKRIFFLHKKIFFLSLSLEIHLSANFQMSLVPAFVMRDTISDFFTSFRHPWRQNCTKTRFLSRLAEAEPRNIKNLHSRAFVTNEKTYNQMRHAGLIWGDSQRDSSQAVWIVRSDGTHNREKHTAVGDSVRRLSYALLVSFLVFRQLTLNELYLASGAETRTRFPPDHFRLDWAQNSAGNSTRQRSRDTCSQLCSFAQKKSPLMIRPTIVFNDQDARRSICSFVQTRSAGAILNNLTRDRSAPILACTSRANTTSEMFEYFIFSIINAILSFDCHVPKKKMFPVYAESAHCSEIHKSAPIYYSREVRTGGCQENEFQTRSRTGAKLTRPRAIRTEPSEKFLRRRSRLQKPARGADPRLAGPAYPVWAHPRRSRRRKGSPRWPTRHTPDRWRPFATFLGEGTQRTSTNA